jgi:hypothetical protein
MGLKARLNMNCQGPQLASWALLYSAVPSDRAYPAPGTRYIEYQLK